MHAPGATEMHCMFQEVGEARDPRGVIQVPGSHATAGCREHSLRVRDQEQADPVGEPEGPVLPHVAPRLTDTSSSGGGGE